MHTMSDQNLSPAQVNTLTRAMLSVARVDSVQPAEAALIGQFYETSRNGDMPTTATFLASSTAHEFATSELAGSTAAFADTVVLMCLMTAYADGNLSAEELTHIQTIAKSLEMETTRFDAHLARVRDDLVAALSHLPDAGSVAAVVLELTTVG